MVDTKQTLLDSAERAARSRGYDGFSYADLAIEVGIRKASIHHHFPTKAEMSVALMKRYQDKLRSVCINIDAGSSLSGARLAAIVDHYKVAVEDGKSLCLCVSFSTSPESLPAETIVQINRFRMMVINWLTAVFETGLSDGSIQNISSPKSEAVATLSLLEGAQIAARAAENIQAFQNATQLLRKRIIQVG